jgi:ATP-dependent Clp protease protease subunit
MIMLQKLNIKLDSKENSNQNFLLFMDEVTTSSCKNIVEWIFTCNFDEHNYEMLNLIICSPGGDLNAAFAVIDTMKGSHVPVRTIGLGQIASAGLLMFIAGEPGHRILTPNTSILSHQYSWGSYGKEHELFAQVKEFDLTTKRMINHYKKCTGLKEEQIREVLLPPQDIWLSAQEAKKLNLCDQVKDLY